MTAETAKDFGLVDKVIDLGRRYHRLQSCPERTCIVVIPPGWRFSPSIRARCEWLPAIRRRIIIVRRGGVCLAYRGPAEIGWPKRSKPMTLAGVGGDQSLSVAEPSSTDAILRPMKVEEIAEVVAKLPPDQLARFRRWFTAFEAGRPDHAQELDSTAVKLGRLAGRAFAELKKRAKEP
jgi:hypothetical protein